MSSTIRTQALCQPRCSSWAIPTSVRPFSHITARRNQSESTLRNLRIGKHTRVIFQGFTGRQATANAKESIAWGTNIVGGVKPGGEGEHLGLPVLPSVRKAVEVLRPDATGIYVAAHQATAAIEEAIEAEVPLIVAVAEHIPLHDIMRIHSMLKSQTASRLVGANSPGIISSVGKCRIGSQPLPCFSPGIVGIVARSGTLSYETAASTLRSGLGQSMCIGVGGDVLPGTTILDGLKVLTDDPDTKAIALVGEIGGHAEIEAAEWIKQYHSSTANHKPIVAIIGGINAPLDRIMGHAGAFQLPGEPQALEKIAALESAGVTLVNHPSRFGPVIKALLEGKSADSITGSGVKVRGNSTILNKQQQSRGLHTLISRRPARQAQLVPRDQKRGILLDANRALDVLKEKGIETTSTTTTTTPILAVTINRSTSSPCVLVSHSGQTSTEDVSRFDFDYREAVSGSHSISAKVINEKLNFSPSSTVSLQKLIDGLIQLFISREAYLIGTRIVEEGTVIRVSSAKLGFDDAAFRSCKRQEDTQALRDLNDVESAEREAEKDGIVYVKLANGNIGTLVNGAGLAMNTVDALADAGGQAANFLDTGGKATSETVKKSFEAILKDDRVKAIFVNIFGGLTLGDMIADGVVLAFKEVDMRGVPVVVRIRGTNEKEGQKIIKESGLDLFAYDDFDEAAAKVIELANRA